MTANAAAHVIEEELTGRLPRRVIRRPGKSMFTVGCLRVFILPFVAVGIGIALAFVGNIGFWIVNQQTHGQVAGREITTDSDGGTTYYVDYSYRVDGETYRNRDSVNRESYFQAETGVRMPVAYLTVRPGLYSAALLPGHSVLRHIGFLLLFGLFWNGIVSVFIMVGYVAPHRERKLYERGEVAVGAVIKKATQSSDDGMTYRIEYSCEGSPVIQPLSGKTTVTKAEWDLAREGDRVTVLYDPRRPKRNVAYRYGNYQIARDI